MSLSRDKKRELAERFVRPLLTRLASLPASEWEHAEASLRAERLAPGDRLTRAGEVADRFGFVIEGVLKKSHVTPNGRAVVRGFGGPGTVVGAYASLLSGEPSYLDVEAISDSLVLVLDWSVLLELYERDPAWQVVGRRIAETLLLEREARAHELLTLSASERYRAFCQANEALLPVLKSYDIASYLGITAVSLSRLKARESRKNTKAPAIPRNPGAS